MQREGALVGGLALLCYLNSLRCGLVFDDASAVRDNPDLRPATPLADLFRHDFWGTPIHKEQSHKSYRPLCVLTFRLSYALHGLEPWGYHLANVLLHAAVCLLYLRLCREFLPSRASCAAALLFAVHPIHTEAVTGVVGRAELLSSLFFLLALLSYIRCSRSDRRTEWAWLLSCILCLVLATLSKEQGITVAAVCVTYELFVVQNVRVRDLWAPPAWGGGWPRTLLLRVSAVVAAALGLLAARLSVMGARLPVFTKFDNPAAAAGFPARPLTHAYLLPLNAWLLLCPSALCCDWTMGSVPLLRGPRDPRNLATLLLAAALAALLRAALLRRPPLALALSLLAFPFLPASNLFFPVGFVVAERVLYLPSMGLCMLVAGGWDLLLLRSGRGSSRCLHCLMGALLVLHSVKTVVRNRDWSSELELFSAGLRVNGRNAKLHNNVGHALESRGDFREALRHFLQASEVQPDDIGAHMNVGRTYVSLGMHAEAERAFWKAKALLPRARAGEAAYQARIAPSHLNVFLNLANLISRDGTRLWEADALYRQAIGMRADYVQAYINRGDILIKLNRSAEAQEVYERALEFDRKNPDIYYNLGVVHLEQGRPPEALAYFDRALELDPEHEQALMNSAILIQESGQQQKRRIARDRLQRLLRRGRADERVFFNLGMVAMDDGDTPRAEDWFRRAIQAKPDFRSALFNLALLLSDDRRPLEAEPVLRQLLQHHPEHVKGLILLGDVYINHSRDLDAAQECYERILRLEPGNVQAVHNLCVVHVERGLLPEAEACLARAVALAPREEYLRRHLAIVRRRIRQGRTPAR